MGERGKDTLTHREREREEGAAIRAGSREAEKPAEPQDLSCFSMHHQPRPTHARTHAHTQRPPGPNVHYISGVGVHTQKHKLWCIQGSAGKLRHQRAMANNILNKIKVSSDNNVSICSTNIKCI